MIYEVFLQNQERKENVNGVVDHVNFERRGWGWLILEKHPTSKLVPKENIHTTTGEEKIHAGSVSGKKLMLHREQKIMPTSSETNFLVHETVKENRAYAKSPTHPNSPQKSNSSPQGYKLVFLLFLNILFFLRACDHSFWELCQQQQKAT